MFVLCGFVQVSASLMLHPDRVTLTQTGSGRVRNEPELRRGSKNPGPYVIQCDICFTCSHVPSRVHPQIWGSAVRHRIM